VEYIALAFAVIVLALAIVPAPVIRIALLVAWGAMMAAVVLAAIPYSG